MRRTLLFVFAVALALCAGCSVTRDAPPSYRTFDRAAQSTITPEQALAELKAGNRRFVVGESIRRDLVAQRAQTSSGQFPFAAVIACLDSRSAPELVFDQGIGDLFVGRVAGNIVNEDLLGSLEFATRVAGARLIVVLGHTGCGAVRGACDGGVELGHLTGLLERIQPAVSRVPGHEGERHSRNAAFVHEVTEMNVRLAVAQVTARSPTLAAMVSAGELKVIGAVHDIASGEVSWLE